MKKLSVTLCAALVATMAFVTIFAGPVYALPSLQLGPDPLDDPSTWTYVDETWFVDESSFALNAYATAEGVAYLVVSAVPMMDAAAGDVFNVTVSNDNSDLTFVSGFGTPPISDPLSPHGIYPTYFEIYEFVFDVSSVGEIPDTQPDQTGSGDGYTETFYIDIDWLADGVTGVHFDLFTKDLEGFIAFAPFSHDAETAPVPEPATMLLLGVGLIGIAGLGRKKLIKK